MKNLLYILLFVPIALFGQENYSLSFDGVDDYVEVINSVIPESGNFTVGLKLFCNESYGHRQAISQGGTLQNSLYIGLNDIGNVRVGGGSDWTFETEIPMLFNEWVSICVVKDSSITRFYLNGELLDSSNVFTNPINSNFMIGNNQNNGFNEWWNGKIDDISIWDKSFTQNELLAIISCPVVGLEEGLIGYWNFNEGSGDTVYDLSGNGNDGTIYGATYSEDVPQNYCNEGELDTEITDIPLLDGYTFIGSQENSIYYISNDISTWEDANEIATNLGGHLVTITSEEENEFIWNAVYNQGYNPGGSNNYQAWIGLYQNTESISYQEPEGGWQWVNGEEFLYSNWDPSEPDNNDGGYFAHISDGNCPLNGGQNYIQCGTWNDDNISTNLTSAFHVIEYEYGCTNIGSSNYDSIALIDDGSCINAGCMDSTATNYNTEATVDDGSCTFIEYIAADLLPNDTSICEGDMLNISVLSEVNTDYLVNNGWSQIYSIGQSTYWLLDQDVTWEEANEFAQQAGGYLYSPNTQEEHLNLYNQLANTGNDGISYWIGMYQDINASNYTEPNGGWVLSDGSVPNYYNWAISEPSNGGGDEHVVQFEWGGIGAQWNDAEGFDSDGDCGCYIARPIIEMNNQFNNIIWSTGDTVSEISLPIFENQNIIIEIQDNDIVYTDTIYITLLTQEVCYLFENSNPILAVQQALLTIDTLLNQGVIMISSLQQALDTWNTIIDLDEGWNIFGYGCPNPIDVYEGLSNHTESIAIVKDNNGSVYMPEFGFNGIGDFTPGFGYQIKLSDAIEGFSLCDWYVNDIPEDNIVSLQEENASLQAELDSIYGCTGSWACNYDETAIIDDGSCYDNNLGCGCDIPTPEEGYDCYGNFLIASIGDFAFGGIVFYLDETGQHGLVAAVEDLTDGASDPNNWGHNGYEWGCDGIITGMLGDEVMEIGAGYQNTINIINNGCMTENGGINAAQASIDYESEGYSDWYLPSLYELWEMYTTIGNSGNFIISLNGYYWSSSEMNYTSAKAIYTGELYPGDGLGGFTYPSKYNTGRVRTIRSF